MKFNKAHFNFETVSQRLKKEILAEYTACKAKTKKTEHDKLFIEMVQKKIDEIKFKLVGTHIPSGVKKSWMISQKEGDYESYMKSLVDAVRMSREEAKKQLSIKNKMFEGSPYETVGGVMRRPNLVNEIGKKMTINDPFKAKNPRKNKVNYIGVELEFNANVPNENVDSIARALTAAGLSRYVCVGTDSSCGFEVRVLLEDTNFEETLTKIIEVLKGKGFTTDRRCGTHVHLDMRNRDVKKCYKNLFSSQMFLRKFISKDRKKNTYCRKNVTATFDDEVMLGDRYRGINVHSHRKYKTLEIRMHQGTLDAAKLISWIKLLVKVVNYEGELVTKVMTLKQASEKLKLEEGLFKDLEARLLSRGA